ncbi:MAG: hypothetical protein AB7E61_06735 [Acholeplasmataceae bacterium]
MKEKFVWYACYGSNICEDRFLCYIDGIEREICGIKIKNNGCTNIKKPIENKVYEFKHNIYFDKKSNKWGKKGVAFIDLEHEGFAYGRIYKITEEQFSQIRCQEGRGLSWYGYPQNDFTDPIDEVDGIKVYTFTQKNNNGSRNMPSDEYKAVIIKGLMEIGLTKSIAIKYLDLCEKQ